MKTIKSLHYYFTAILLLVSMQISGQDSQLTGQVTDSKSEFTLPFVHVQLAKSSPAGWESFLITISDVEGDFSFSDLEAGNYRLTVRNIGYQVLHQEIQLTQGESKQLTLALIPGLMELGEVSVTSIRYEQAERNVALPIEVIPRQYFPRNSSRSMADVMSQEPGIALYRDGAWGTSVSIRGLGENRLVSLVNGSRIETATDLAGSLSMIDVHEIERVEVIKGAASTLYGTGAIGGIVNVITKKGEYLNNWGVHGEATALYEGVNNLLGTHVALHTGSKKWFARVSGGYRVAGNIMTPEGVLENSQFEDHNFNASFGVKPLKNHEFVFQAQEFMANNVGIPGGAPLAPTAIASYDLANRRLVTAAYSIKDLSEKLKRIELKYYYQMIDRDVRMYPNAGSVLAGNNRITANRVMPSGVHYTHGGSLTGTWQWSDSHQLLAGIDVWQRRIETIRYKYITQEILDDFDNVLQVLELVKGENPIPDATFGSAGLFLQDEYTLLNDRLTLSLGARIDGIRVSNEQAIDPISLTINEQAKEPVPGQQLVFEADQQMDFSWSAHAGALYHLNQQLDATANFGRSFRSPSLEERFKYIDLGAKVRIGDPELDPEKAWFTDLGLRFWNDNITAQINGFAHYITNMIVEMPGDFEKRLFVDDEYVVTDTLPALVNTNVNQAWLMGFEAKANYAISSSLVAHFQAAYVRGWDTQNGTDLPLIAPFSASLGMRYQLPGIFNVSWTTTGVAAQNKIAAGENASPGYYISDFTLFSVPRQVGPASFQFFTGVNNVFNRDYVNHLATNRGLINVEPGRNVYIKLQMRF